MDSLFVLTADDIDGSSRKTTYQLITKTSYTLAARQLFATIIYGFFDTVDKKYRD